GRTRVLAWPLWEGDGMQAPQTARNWAESTVGLVAMPVAVGLRALDEALASDVSHVVIAYGHAKRVREAFLRPVPLEPTAANPRVSSNTLHFRPALLRLLRHGISSVLKLDDAEIQNDVRLSDFGFDSISFTELSSHLNRTLDLAT